MITRLQLETLVERVLNRLSEVGPPPARTGNFRYDASGNSVATDDDELQVNPTAKTQMPSTMPPQTIPAAKSATQQQVDKETAGSRNPNRGPASAPSQKQIKVNAIKKSLDKLGYTHSSEGAKNATQNLAGWYDQLDPAEALVSTADDLAKRFSGQG